MPERPIIGVPTQTLEEIPGELPRCWVMSQQYIRVLVDAGAVPWIIPLLRGDRGTLRAIYERVDGIFLPGGVDLHPAAYEEQPRERCGRTDPDRDATELTLTRWAMADHKPLLAVCRGVQVINVAAGGSVHQDLASEFPGSIKHDYFPGPEGYTRDLLVHEVRIPEDTRLGRLLGSSSVKVNSMHHQGIKRVAEGLRPNAYAPDGLIEGLESPNGHFLLGVQWHPEALVGRDEGMRRLFAAFVEEAAR
jgi:putative glutamine amidotransferase